MLTPSLVRYCPPWLVLLAVKYPTLSPPVSKFSTCTVPGIAAGVPPYGCSPLATANQLKLPTLPLLPAVSMRSWITCCPADRVMLLEIVCQVCQPPVLGTVSSGVAVAPSTLKWKVPPAPLHDTRT